MSYQVMAEAAKRKLARQIEAACDRELEAHRAAFSKVEVFKSSNLDTSIADLIRIQQLAAQQQDVQLRDLCAAQQASACAYMGSYGSSYGALANLFGGLL